MPERFRTLHDAVVYFRRKRGLTASQVHALVDKGEIAIGPPPLIAPGETLAWDGDGRARIATRPDAAPIAREPETPIVASTRGRPRKIIME